jgi:cyclophilin family peptidyl-prolyl cis-trans isomerase
VILSNLILLVGALGSVPVGLDTKPKVEWTAPDNYSGGEYLVHVVLDSAKEAASVPAWLITASAFDVNGKPLGERGDATIQMGPGKLTLDLDLGPSLQKSGYEGKDFKLGYAKEFLGGEEKGVRVMQAAEKGLDFMKIPVEELSKYHVILSTNQGDMEAEFWPDVAPNHVRNFLDLSYTGFYDGKIFHRVIPGFMIQGGDPTGTGTGSGPRMLKAEFNDRKHVPGVLSMARSSDPNSASCQFFVMHKTSTSLDGQYSAFGKLVSGQDVVEKIVNVKRNSQDKPFEPQTIKKATVVKTTGK